MPGKKVSVVIVSFRSAQLAIDCLRSIERERSQADTSINAIVVDNASGDFQALSQTIDANDWTSWVTLLLAPRNGGFAYGNNVGIRFALALNAPEYILLLNPDTQVRSGAIRRLARFLEDHPEVGIAGGSFEYPDGTEWSVAFRFPTMISEVCSALSIGFVTRFFNQWTIARPMPPAAQAVDWICGASMMIRSEVFRAIGGMDENYFLYFEETEFCLRARRSGFSTWYVPESRVMHICGQSTGVTEPRASERRLPAYWFDSRRRYFTTVYGLRLAMVIDLIVMITYPVGWLKRLVLRQSHASVPHYFRDFARSSVLWPHNRHVAALRASLEQAAPTGSAFSESP